MGYELYWNDSRNMLIVENLEISENKRLDETSSAFIQKVDAAIARSQPQKYKALCDEYGYGPEYAGLRVFQFSACNFSTKDGRIDIDDDFNFVTEIVSCPVRHKCDRIYCCKETPLSVREIQIIRLFVTGMSEEHIADNLFLSSATVHNHMTNIYHKLNLSGRAHPDRLLILYAYNNRLIK